VTDGGANTLIGHVGVWIADFSSIIAERRPTSDDLVSTPLITRGNDSKSSRC